MEKNIKNYKEESENIRLKLELCNRELELSKRREIEIYKQNELELLRMQKEIELCNREF